MLRGKILNVRARVNDRSNQCAVVVFFSHFLQSAAKFQGGPRFFKAICAHNLLEENSTKWIEKKNRCTYFKMFISEYVKVCISNGPLKIKQNVKLQYLNVNSVCIGLGLGYKRALIKSLGRS